jgi:hypothetical protein
MSARDIIEIMKRLPEAERNQVIHYFGGSHETEPTPEQKEAKMNVDDAIDHVFKNYSGLLAKLAQ